MLSLLREKKKKLEKIEEHASNQFLISIAVQSHEKQDWKGKNGILNTPLIQMTLLNLRRFPFLLPVNLFI